jgi:adenylate cyclase
MASAWSLGGAAGLLVASYTSILVICSMLGTDCGMQVQYLAIAACMVGTSLILFAIVFYAVRQTARAEEVAEREYTRSATLLRNILPEAIATRLKS